MTKPYKQPALATTRRKWSKRVKELAALHTDPFDGAGHWTPVNPMAVTIARVIRKGEEEGFKPAPKKTAKPAPKKKAKTQPKKTTKKRVAKQTKQPASPVLEVLFESPEGNTHWLPLVPENSELLLSGWKIVDADDKDLVAELYGEAM